MSEWRDAHRRFIAAIGAGDLVAAEQHLEELRDLANRFERRWSIQLAEGLLRLKQMDYEACYMIYLKAAEQVRRRRHWAPYYAQAVHGAALAARLNNRPAAAIELLEKELAVLGPRRLEKRMAVALRDFGIALHDLGRYDEALARFDEVEALSDDVPWHHKSYANTWAARTLMIAKRPAEALARLARATHAGGRAIDDSTAEDLVRAWTLVGAWMRRMPVAKAIADWYVLHLEKKPPPRTCLVDGEGMPFVLEGDPDAWRVVARHRKRPQVTVASLAYGLHIVVSDLAIHAGEIVTVKLDRDRVVAIYELS